MPRLARPARRIVAACAMFATCLCSCIAVAEPAQEGMVRAHESAVSEIRLDQVGVVNRREINMELQSSYFRLHFADVKLPPGADLAIDIRDRNDGLLVSIPASDLVARESYWTSVLSGTYALIEIRNLKSVDGSLRMRVADLGTEAHGAKFLSVQNPADPKDLPIRMYASKPGIIAAGRAVAKLAFVKDKLMLSCTGFLVTSELMLTNQHCFDTQASCDSTTVIFGFEQDANLDDIKGEEQRCVQVVASDPDLDVSLIKVSGTPGARWGVLRWAEKAPPKGAPLYVVQHPGGRAKRVALDGCKVSTAKAPGIGAGKATDLGHRCDTEEGSSGSPVLGLDNRVVALHHLGFGSTNTPWARENRAVLASFIQARIAEFTP